VRDPKKRAEINRRWKANNKEKVRESARVRRATSAKARASIRAAQVRRDFGLSRDSYERMLQEQQGRCKICGGANKNGWALHVDHCHETGVVRALLCFQCNTAVGWAEQRGGEDAVQALAEYIREAQAQKQSRAA